MKKRNILYLLTIILALFSFNSKVMAAQELTCVYSKDYSLILTQDSNGAKKMYYNQKKDAQITDVGWALVKGDTDVSQVSSSKKSSNSDDLNSCPEKVHIASNTYEFFDNENWFDEVGEFFENIGGVILDFKSGDNQLNKFDLSIKIPDSNIDVTKSPLISIDNSKYIASCKYKRVLNDGTTHYVQLIYGKDKFMFSEYDPVKQGEFSAYSNYVVKYTGTSIIYDFYIDLERITIDNLLVSNEGNCPVGLGINRHEHDDRDCKRGNCVSSKEVSTEVKSFVGNVENAGGDLYALITNKEEAGDMGINPLTGKKITVAASLDVKPIILKKEIKNCDDLLGEDFSKYINFLWNLIKIGIPIILIGMGTMDFVQAIFSGKEDGMNKAKSKFIKRIIIAVIIFLVPTILSLLLNIANDIWGGFGEDLCGLIF